MQVLKFGGSSVKDAVNIKQTASVIRDRLQHGKTWVVVSALGGVTDDLLRASELASAGDEQYRHVLQHIETRHLETVRELLPLTEQSALLSEVKSRCNELLDICQGIFLLGELSNRTRDRIVSYGEWLSSRMIARYLQTEGVDATWADSRTLIVTNDRFGHAQVLFEETNQRIQTYSDSNGRTLVIFPGFIASTVDGVTTTLGRGGSDYTAAILAAAVHADVLEIWTDVSGMMTADPRLVSGVQQIPEISYAEAMELSHFGAKVIYPPTIQPVQAKGIPTWIKNTFAPQDEGTLIHSGEGKSEQTIRGLSSMNRIALLSLEGGGMVGIPGFSGRLFTSLAQAGINVILITQSSSEYSICVAVESTSANRAKDVLDMQFDPEIQAGKLQPVQVELGLSILAIVGDQMKNHTGISGRMFSALGRNGVNIRAIAQGSSERNISAVVSESDVAKALNVLHESFFADDLREINLFVAGVGNVGARLLAQLEQQTSFLETQLRLRVRVVGLCNSKKALIQTNGIDLAQWRALLDAHAEPATAQTFAERMIALNLRNTVFADVTASSDVANTYAALLAKSIAVVACNKIAASGPYPVYAELQHLTKEYRAPFLFETNVGAGLPIISTLKDLIRSGDQVYQIQAVLSGTLNFVFNHYDTSKPFAEVVRQAQAEGYTEPDPRLDLSGIDVMRKIAILVREAGIPLELDAIANPGFMPARCMEGDIASFYRTMLEEEDHFAALYKDAASRGAKLKFVAQFKDGKASVGLQHIDASHDFYHLYGKDNIVLFYTARYPQQPLVVKGAGAGAEVTASGVFADILRTLTA